LTESTRGDGRIFRCRQDGCAIGEVDPFSGEGFRGGRF
jgi:hypothetical protein